MILGSLERVVEHVDTDAHGVVHFTRYLSLAESAVLHGLGRAGVGGQGSGDESHGTVVVTAVEARYHASARYADTLQLDAHVDTVRGATLTVSVRVTTGNPSCDVATVVLTLCFVDDAGRGRPIHPDLRSRLDAGRHHTHVQHQGGS